MGLWGAVLRLESCWRAVSRREELLRRAGEMALHNPKDQNHGCGPNHPAWPPSLNRVGMGLEPVLGRHCAGVWRPKCRCWHWALKWLSEKALRPGCPCPAITEFLAVLVLPSQASVSGQDTHPGNRRLELTPSSVMALTLIFGNIKENRSLMLRVEIMPFLNSILLVKNRCAPFQGNNPIS